MELLQVNNFSLDNYILTLGIFIFSYFLGAIPFGLIISKVFGLGNLRNVGSGNIGATNVLRTGNKIAALATLILDGGKGALAVILARIISEDAAITASICVIVGHIYPVWMKFNGGKGVATFIGVILALNFVAGVLVCSVWLIIALAFRYSSLAALISSISALLWVLFFYGDKALIVTLIMIILIWLRHKKNIKRLIEGSEKKIGDH